MHEEMDNFLLLLTGSISVFEKTDSVSTDVLVSKVKNNWRHKISIHI